MKKLTFLIPLMIIIGCTQTPEVSLNVPFHSVGCSGFDESYSEVMVTNEGLSLVSNIISDVPCYNLDNAELVFNEENNITVIFTLSKDTFCDKRCQGLQSFIYTINGEGMNHSGINLEIITLLGSEEIRHTITS